VHNYPVNDSHRATDLFEALQARANANANANANVPNVDSVLRRYFLVNVARD
jgi:hypothetical protein